MERYLTVEHPGQTVTVDFLNEGVTLTITVKDGQIRVEARVSHGEGASTWDKHEVEWAV